MTKIWLTLRYNLFLDGTLTLWSKMFSTTLSHLRVVATINEGWCGAGRAAAFLPCQLPSGGGRVRRRAADGRPDGASGRTPGSSAGPGADAVERMTADRGRRRALPTGVERSGRLREDCAGSGHRVLPLGPVPDGDRRQHCYTLYTISTQTDSRRLDKRLLDKLPHD